MMAEATGIPGEDENAEKAPGRNRMKVEKTVTRYWVPRHRRTHLAVSREVSLAVKHYAQNLGVTVTEAVYRLIQYGFASEMLRAQEDLLRKKRLHRKSWQECPDCHQPLPPDVEACVHCGVGIETEAEEDGREEAQDVP